MALIRRDLTNVGVYNDTRYYYFLPDPNDDGHGRCLFLLHGGGGNCLKIGQQAAVITAQNDGTFPWHVFLVEGWQYYINGVNEETAPAGNPFRVGNPYNAVTYINSFHAYHNDGRRENFATLSGVEPAIERDDVVFLSTLIAAAPAIATALGVTLDPTKFAIGGGSNGAMMSQRMVCEQRSLFAAMLLVSGEQPMTYLASPPTAIPTYITHGSEDPHMQTQGGSPLNPGRGRVRPIGNTIAFWQRVNGVMAAGGAVPAPTVTQIENINLDDSSYAEKRDWTGGTKPVRYVRVTGGGHTWPVVNNPIADDEGDEDSDGAYNQDFGATPDFSEWALALPEFA